MSEILNRNIKLLEKYQPFTFKKVDEYLKKQYKPLNNNLDRIIVAQQDEIILNLLLIADNKEFLICDHEDPISEAYSWIDKFIDPSNKAEIVFGMGFGYHIEVLHTSFKNKKILIIEPNIELFLQIIKIRNLETIIKNCIMFVDEEINSILKSIYSLYWDTNAGGIQCQPLGVYEELFPDTWGELRDKFIKQGQSVQVDIATRKGSGEIWIQNYINNLSDISKASNTAGLIDKFRGKPGILVSAGPSLLKNIELIKDMKDKCVIIAAGTAVNILEKNGIIPHFMVGIDAWESEAEVHKKVKSQDIYFIYSNQVATGSLKSYTGPKFLMNYTADLYTNEFFEYSGIKSDFFISGPSVANTCFDILLKLGCNPIILTGQDLAYSGGSKYAGEVSESTINSATEGLKDRYILTKDIYDNDIFTSLGFIAMKNFFEGYFERVKDKVEIINATEGGLNLENARNDTLQNVIDKYDFKPFEIENMIKEVHESHSFQKNIDEKLQEYRNSIVLEIEKLENYSDEQLKLVDLLKRDFYHPAKNKKAFEKNVTRIIEFSDIVMESKIFNSVLRNLLEIDFYLIKVELERATKQLTSYNEVKEFYIRAIISQNEILLEKLNKIRGYLNCQLV